MCDAAIVTPSHRVSLLVCGFLGCGGVRDYCIEQWQHVIGAESMRGAVARILEEQ